MFSLLPILSAPAYGDIIQNSGIQLFGSVAVFGLVVLAVLMYIMIQMKVPGQFILITLGFAGVAMGLIWGNPTIKIIAYIVAIIFGYIAGTMVLKVFNRGGE